MRVLIRDLRPDDQGVASTVGTIMALLVFLTFLSLIVNQYVPVWMKDSEAAHMNTVLGQFGGLKGSVDLQILAFQAAQASGTPYIPMTAATPVTLGVEGVPIFATATVGTLRASPDVGPFTVVFDYEITGLAGSPVRTRVSELSNGSVELSVGNRYYVPQTVAFENGAVIRQQSDGQIIRAQPTFRVIRANASLEIVFGLVSFYGGGTISGTTTEVVNAQVFTFDRQDFGANPGEGFPSDAVIWMNHTSRYGHAWYRFLNSTLASSLGLAGSYTRTPLDESFTGMLGGEVVYTISTTLNPAAQVYITRLAIHNNPGMLALSVFRLGQAQVQISVGETVGDVQL